MDPFQLFNDDERLTTAEAAQAVNVNPHTVRKWRSRGYLDPQGEHRRLPVIDYDEQGNPRHRYADVRAAEIATHNSRNSHRRTSAPQTLASLPGRLREVNWDRLDRRRPA